MSRQKKRPKNQFPEKCVLRPKRPTFKTLNETGVKTLNCMVQKKKYLWKKSLSSSRPFGGKEKRHRRRRRRKIVSLVTSSSSSSNIVKVSRFEKKKKKKKNVFAIYY